MKKSKSKKIDTSVILKNNKEGLRRLKINFVYEISLVKELGDQAKFRIFISKFFEKSLPLIKFSDLKDYMRIRLSRSIGCTYQTEFINQVELVIQNELKITTIPHILNKRFTLNWKKIEFKPDKFLLWLLFAQLPTNWYEKNKYDIFLEIFTIQKTIYILLTASITDKVVLIFYCNILCINLINLIDKLENSCYLQK